ncbi:MAG: PKD domain-containing protein [Bacteroidetes bacterium]|nr:MAG: PKD domain-containing protein [Bacteroidota bacterium]
MDLRAARHLHGLPHCESRHSLRGYRLYYFCGAAPLLNPGFVPGPAQCLQNNSFNFTAAGTFQGTGAFQWTFGPNAAPASSSQQNVSGVTFNAPGNYSVTLTVSENGCVDSFTAVVTVLPEPVFSFNAPPVTGCNPVTVQFSDSSFADTSVTMVIWNFGDGGTSTQTNPNHVYTQAGTYDVSVIIVTNNPCVGTVSFTVTGMVTVYPAPKAGLSATPTTLTMFDTLVTFTDMSQGATNCWIWYGDGDSSSNCGGTHAYGASGNYTVTQIVENQYGCRDQFELLIDADMDAIFWIPNAFTPNHDGKNEMFMPVAIGIQNFRMWIFDRWGNLIFETIDVNHGWNGTFKGDRCQQDVYVWKCEFEKASKDNTPYKRIGHVSLVH